MKLDTMMEAIEVLARERGVAIDTILDAFANALVAAYKRSPGAAEEARVTIDPDSGEVIVYAQELDEEGNVISEWEDTPEGWPDAPQADSPVGGHGSPICWYWRSDADGVATWGPTSRPVPQWTRPGATPVETLGRQGHH